MSDLEKHIANCKHQSKPEKENVTTFYNREGRWIFEVYSAGHTVKFGDVKKHEVE